MAKKFICSQCGQTFEAASMPDKCPICGADTSHLSEVKSKGINTNGNVYTICYAAVMVVLVAFLLAFVSSALKPAQDANVAIDKKKQILASLNVRGIAKSDVEAKFDELIQETCVVTPDGQVTEGGAFEVETKEIGEKFPVYKAKTAAGDEALVLPLKGRGLWGGLWGYVAVTPDFQKVLGAYFDHESETAGLGALIKEEKFQSQFIGRPVMGADGKVALTVVKKGASEAETQIDGVTGATLTSKGVGEMVLSGIQQYVDALGAGKPAGSCKNAQKCCEKPDCKCAEKKACACKDGSCGDAACNCASDAKCCAREECPCACCEKAAPCEKKHEGCGQHEGCPKAQQGCGGCPEKAEAPKCQSGSDCCKSGKCDKSGSCGKPGCDGDKACCGHK